jgi:hypothetical protein
MGELFLVGQGSPLSEERPERQAKPAKRPDLKEFSPARTCQLSVPLLVSSHGLIPLEHLRNPPLRHGMPSIVAPSISPRNNLDWRHRNIVT